MKYNLPERVIRDISTFAKKHSVEKVILFGSRARGTNTERSDIDIAVYGGDFNSFYWDIKEKVHSLLMFDIVEIDAGISEELRKEIKKDGVVIYEKAWKFFELLKCIEMNILMRQSRLSSLDWAICPGGVSHYNICEFTRVMIYLIRKLRA